MRGIAIDEVSIPDVPTGDLGGGGALTYFLTIDGLNGGSLNKEHPGAFEIDGFDFDVSALAGGKGSDDLLVFSPLTIDLILNSGLTALLAMSPAASPSHRSGSRISSAHPTRLKRSTISDLATSL